MGPATPYSSWAWGARFCGSAAYVAVYSPDNQNFVKFWKVTGSQLETFTAVGPVTSHRKVGCSADGTVVFAIGTSQYHAVRWVTSSRWTARCWGSVGSGA